MTGLDEAAVESAVEALTERLRDGGPGPVLVQGPSGSGRSAVLRAVAERFPEAVLVDAAGRSADAVVAELIERIGALSSRRPSYRDLIGLGSALRRERAPRTVLVANGELAGSLRSGGEPLVVRALLRTLWYAATEGRLRLVIETGTAAPYDQWPSKPGLTVVPLSDGPGPEQLRELTAAVSAETLAALRALADGQLRRVPAAAWAQLCEAAEVPVDAARLTTLAAELRWLDESRDGIGFSTPALVAELRRPAAEAAAFHSRMTDRLLAGDLAEDWAVRSLPGHAVAAGRFDELLADARAVARVPQSALVEGFRAGYRETGIAPDTHAAALHFLTGYGLEGAPHGEWVARLAHDAFTRGQSERAEELARACPEPLPFRTVWSHWRPAGDFTPPTGPVHHGDVEIVEPVDLDGRLAVVTEGSGDVRLLRDAATGELLAELSDPAYDGPQPVGLPPEAAALTVRPSWGYTYVLPTGADPKAEPLGVLHHPEADYANAVGELLVVTAARGAYAVRLDAGLLREGPHGQLRSVVGAHGRVLPRAFDPSKVADLRGLLERAFGAERLHRPTEDELPAGITDPATRRLLTTVGLPRVEGLSGLWLTPQDGLPVREWESTPDAGQPSGSGPFHLIGDWMGGPLVLDGSDGRVLRMLRPDTPEYQLPRQPLVGRSLESFLAMVGLERQYLRVYRTGGPDTAEVLAELQVQLAGVDGAAAASDVWQYALDPDNRGD
ncbi:SUKH-4 family immunity protein [Kitasatospora sp. NPDC096147]|uniref:SUKH-4 family immunity protein n=1 Tax=Kitasatospora sp. NPDC096147 TaxID=3364093 RepID=UPI0038053FA1